jgi:hypothetical protein
VNGFSAHGSKIAFVRSHIAFLSSCSARDGGSGVTDGPPIPVRDRCRRYIIIATTRARGRNADLVVGKSKES